MAQRRWPGPAGPISRVRPSAPEPVSQTILPGGPTTARMASAGAPAVRTATRPTGSGLRRLDAAQMQTIRLLPCGGTGRRRALFPTRLELNERLFY